MVHNLWLGGKGLSADDAKIAFGSGEGSLGQLRENGTKVISAESFAYGKSCTT